MRIGLISILLAAGWTVGCATDSRRTSEAASAHAAVPAVPVVPVDYSSEAVARRTEAQARFATGFLHDLNDQPGPAAEEYLRAGLADPANEEMVLEIVGRLMRFKQGAKALELLKKATEQPQASGRLFAQLGLVYSLTGDQPKAITANRAAIEKDPRLLAGYRHLAQIYLQDGQPELGLAVLDDAARQSHVDHEFLTDLGEFYLAFARGSGTDTAKARAKAVWERVARDEPTHPLILQKLADGFLMLGDAEQAIGFYQKLLEQYPQFPRIREKLADLYLRNKDFQRAAGQLESIVRTSPTDPRAYYLLGSIAYEAKDWEKAADHFRKVNLLNPDFEPAYYDLAIALLNLQQATNAVATLAEARERFPRSFTCEFFTGLAYGQLKDYRQAVAALVRAEQYGQTGDTNRLDHRFYFQLGAAYERNQQIPEAVASFRKCLELSPDFSEALNYLGYMWAERAENLGEARQLLEKAVQLEPENAAYLDSLGWVLFRLNQPREALPYLLKAIEKSEQPDPTLYDHLGDVYRALQEPEQARSAWEKALTLDPDDLREAVENKLKALPPAGTPQAKDIAPAR